ncbi:hypothetical protein [Streptomyces uncialis]|uniref:hypothetical protein n=1 Tax=Streptomyces uncialis TaxID=1048205 RepID=UPI00386B7BA4|nr:hypothetical protein OG924_13490 [Streptomyces uncialis]
MSADLLTRTRARGATALRGHRRRPTPFMVFGGLFWLVMSLAYWRVPMCCDFGQHAAVVERLTADLLSPRHPMADLPGDGSPYYTPYAVTQALFAKLTGLAGWEVVKLSGPVNLLVLLTGVARFTRAVSRPTTGPWAPVFALAAMLLLWGTLGTWWSGFLGLMSMTGNLGYPSTFAIGLTFWAWAWTASLVRDSAPRWRGHAGLGALLGLILLVHPITVIAAAVGVAAFVVPAHGRQWLSRAAWRRYGVGLPWLLAVLAACAVAAMWPYFSVFSLAGDSSVDAIHARLYRNTRERFWLGALGLPALWARWRRDGGRDPLVLMFGLDLLVIAYGWFTGHYTYGRVMGMALVPLHFALAVELATPRPWSRRRRALGVAAVAAALTGFLTVHAGAVVPRSLDPVGFKQPPRWPTYAWVTQHVGRGEVILADGYRPARSLPGYGLNLVAPPWPDPALEERERSRRWSAVHTYLAPNSSPTRRAEIVKRYGVRWLLLSPRQTAPPEAVVVAWDPRSGEVLARVRGA